MDQPLADLHLQVHPGTDIVLHHAIGRLLIEQGRTDAAFIRQHTEGFASQCKVLHAFHTAASPQANQQHDYQIDDNDDFFHDQHPRS